MPHSTEYGVNNRELKGVDYARAAIATMAAQTKQHAARVALCRVIPNHGNYDAEGKALFAEYLAQGCPANARAERDAKRAALIAAEIERRDAAWSVA